MSSAADYHDQAEDYFKDDNFAKAAELYDKAIAAASEAGKPVARYYANRANNNLKLKRYEAALADAEQALTLEAGNARALQRKGVALFYLDRFEDAEDAFDAAAAAGFTGDLSLWKRKIAAELDRPAPAAASSSADASSSSAAAAVPVIASSSTPAPIIHKIEALPKAVKPAPVVPQPPAVPLNLAQKTRDQWFQISDEVTISLMAKNVKAEQVTVSLDEATATLKAAINFPSDSSVYEKSWKLCAGVKGQPTINITPYKVEMTLKKLSPGVSWEKLERTGDLPPEVVSASSSSGAETVVPRANIIRDDVNFAAYPTSAKTLKNWTEVEAAAKKAEEEEKPEGEAALQKLFQSIYGGADEDTKRAMIKSFQTSGGTVLSTNWKEVSEKNYEKEREAPKGQEMKDWNSRER